MINCPIKIGSLVVDVDPFKAPELFYGHGVVIETLSDDYVIVHWIKYDFYQATNIGNLEVVND